MPLRETCQGPNEGMANFVEQGNPLFEVLPVPGLINPAGKTALRILWSLQVSLDASLADAADEASKLCSAGAKLFQQAVEHLRGRCEATTSALRQVWKVMAAASCYAVLHSNAAKATGVRGEITTAGDGCLATNFYY